MKKLSLALIALGLSAPAFAGHPGSALPPTVNVTIPQQQGSWSIGVEALYWNVHNGDYQYGITSLSDSTVTPDLTLTTHDNKTHVVNPDNDWGGRIDVAYLLAGNGRDVMLSWTHLDHDDSSRTMRLTGSTLNPTDLDMLFPITQTEFPNGWDELRGSTDNDYDAVDLVFGQKMDFGQKVTLRAFGGLRYADIDITDKTRGFATTVNSVINTLEAVGESRLKTDFSGVGPRAGMDAQVRLSENFSITGTIAGSLVVGDRDKKLDVMNSTANVSLGTVTTETWAYRLSDNTRVVPEMDARIGINFTHSFSPDTAFGVELGYEVTNYFDVKENSLTGFVDTMSHDNDFGMQGPYLRAQLDVA